MTAVRSNFLDDKKHKSQNITFIFGAALMVLVIASAPVLAKDSTVSCQDELTQEDLAALRESHRLLGDVGISQFDNLLKEINATSCPPIQVFMAEAMAKTYADLIERYGLNDLPSRERLYSKINLNMAFLQLTGGRAGEGDSALNRLIVRKLKYYLPQGVLDHPGFYQPMGE